MKSLILLAILTASIQAAAVGPRTNLCKYYYKNDMFSRDLILSLVQEPNGTLTFWMDTPTPYGIRPYGYEVKSLTCNSEKSLHIEAATLHNYEQVVFNSKANNTAGKLEYFNDKNEPTRTVNFECDAAAIATVCK